MKKNFHQTLLRQTEWPMVTPTFENEDVQIHPARVKLIGQAVILLYCVIQLVAETLGGVKCRNCKIHQLSAVDPSGAVG